MSETYVPQATLVFEIEAICQQPEDMGRIGGGAARMIPIIGGTVCGKLNGEVIPGGADWSIMREGGIATVSAGKYLADDVYVQVGAGGAGGVGAEVEWEPARELSIISSAQGNGDTKIAVRWKKDY